MIPASNTVNGIGNSLQCSTKETLPFFSVSRFVTVSACLWFETTLTTISIIVATEYSKSFKEAYIFISGTEHPVLDFLSISGFVTVSASLWFETTLTTILIIVATEYSKSFKEAFFLYPALEHPVFDFFLCIRIRDGFCWFVD